MLATQMKNFNKYGTRKEQAIFKKFILQIKKKQKLSLKKSLRQLNKMYQRLYGRSYLKNNLH